MICRDQDVDDIALKLLELRDSHTREILGNNGVKAVLEKYNWQSDRSRMIQALERMGAREQNYASSAESVGKGR